MTDGQQQQVSLQDIFDILMHKFTSLGDEQGAAFVAALGNYINQTGQILHAQEVVILALVEKISEHDPDFDLEQFIAELNEKAQANATEIEAAGGPEGPDNDALVDTGALFASFGNLDVPDVGGFA